LLILDCSVVRRQEPHFEPPLKAEDANSPVGPLQHHVAEPDFVEWENIDWAALSFDPETPGGGFGGTEGNSGVGLSPNFSSPYVGGADEHLYDFGTGYSFGCAYD
jgi:hypothetical protein